MPLGGIVAAVRKALGKLTDVLLIGRSAGWWQKKPGASNAPRDLRPPK